MKRMRTLLANATLVNEGRTLRGDILIEDDTIKSIRHADNGIQPDAPACDKVVDASGCLVLPGIIDSHVHFREPGMTHKATIRSESRAAAAGGVTTFFDMPNTVPQTTTLEAWADKMERAAKDSAVNYAFFFGATNDNTELVARLDPHTLPGIKLFMGSSTGGMLVDRREALNRLFAAAALPIMAHCEDTATINANMEKAKALHGDDPDVAFHPAIRSREACIRSTELAVEMATKHGARLHVAHVTTREELALIHAGGRITAEATVGHLLFSKEDHASLGTRIKVNPAIKDVADRQALRQALQDGRISTIGTDHAPHLLEEKRGGCARAASGMPMVQFSLVAMLGLVDEGVLGVERLVELMCHNPARLFSVEKRGFLREGYKADIVVVRRGAPWTLTAGRILSPCKWSPLEGRSFAWSVERTFCNGHEVFNAAQGLDDAYRGEAVEFGGLR